MRRLPCATRFPFLLVASLAGCNQQPSLVGTWVHADASTQQTQKWTFNSDGTFSEAQGKDMKTGRWTATEDTLVATSGDQTVTAPIYVNDHVFVFGAMRPNGKHDGVIGAWAIDGAIDNGANQTGYDASWVFGDDGGAFASILDLDG